MSMLVFLGKFLKENEYSVGICNANKNSTYFLTQLETYCLLHFLFYFRSKNEYCCLAICLLGLTQV